MCVYIPLPLYLSLSMYVVLNAPRIFPRSPNPGPVSLRRTTSPGMASFIGFLGLRSDRGTWRPFPYAPCMVYYGIFTNICPKTHPVL